MVRYRQLTGDTHLGHSPGTHKRDTQPGTGPRHGETASEAAQHREAGRELLDAPTRRLFELALASDLGGVRLHAGRGSALLTRLIGSSAVTLGRHVCLGPAAAEACRRRTPAGLELLAHELVHVRQYQRLGALRFLVRYLSGYLSGRGRGLGHDGAYRAIEAEIECFAAASRFAALLGADPGICRALGAGEEPGDERVAGLAGCLADPRAAI